MNLVLVGKPYSNPWKNSWSNLDGLGFFPESLLYRWDAASMTENRVIKIVAAPPKPGSRGATVAELLLGVVRRLSGARKLLEHCNKELRGYYQRWP